jgi:uncharacterized protein YbaR (Trm112 family)
MTKITLLHCPLCKGPLVLRRKTQKYCCRCIRSGIANKASQESSKRRLRSSSLEWRKAHPEAARLHSRTAILRRYGMTPADYARLMLDQSGLCAICLRPPAPGKCLHVDHNHKTGAPRALLCPVCNTVVGLSETNRVPLLGVLSYIRQHSEGVK